MTYFLLVLLSSRSAAKVQGATISQWKYVCSFLIMIKLILKISSYASIQHIFLLFSVLFPLLKLVQLLEKLVEQVEKIESISLELILVFSFGV